MSVPTIGIIAGNGIYPETFIAAARKKVPGVKLVVAGFHGETTPELEELVEAMEWFRVGQLGAVIKFFKKQGASQAIMVGQIAPRNLFDLRPDMRTLMMLAKVKERNAETLFGAVANELQKDGIELMNATTHLEDLLPEPGHVCGPKLKKRAIEDAEFGFRTAKETSRMDIGQSVVVRHGTVLAVEAFEGTNACIKRGGELGRGKSCTLAKVSKPKQDFRFDVPCLGALTIQACYDAGVQVIACEAHKTLILGRDEVEKLCDERGITIIALED
ncbi:LpxI family protein [Rubritalea tangerina]|uniref:LpxI family protein n=1 Tax=Rubritalea tangerina TaxID=430798 RepID=A0ABW4Z8H9_9BACT